MDKKRIKELVGEMALSEKASLCSGEGFWHTKTVEHLGIPNFMMSDGPHGLRKQDMDADHLGLNESIKAVCFPTGCATATSFDRDLIKKLGQTLGEECQSENIGVILGPAINIKRSPLCGRNFEYYSEDPYLASETAASYIDGVQSRGVGVSLKHFCANNQETRRMSVDEKIDERALHEIYLAAFEGAVRQSKPWTVMSSYNKLNGRYVGENHDILTKELRDRWGFDGIVISDWGAVGDRVEALKAGLDVEMPASRGVRDRYIEESVRNKRLPEEVLDLCCERILDVVYRAVEGHDDSIKADFMKDHETAREIASESMVLLKNDDSILPLDEKKGRIAFIGKYAKSPRFQGGGSSHINCIKITSALDAVSEYGIVNVRYAQGFDDECDEVNGEMQAEAVALAKESDVAVIFAGLPDAFETEGCDRSSMKMPDCQNRLIYEILKVQKNVVVVLHNGSPVEMPWVNDVKGIVETYLGGEAVGGALVDVIFGKVNPSGRLAETFPYQLEDNPSWLSGFGSGDEVTYSEGIFVGYRYYDKKKMKVMFPFGHGLSYTQFEYANLTLSKSEIGASDTLKVTVDVTNVGTRAGKEVVQLYVADKESTAIRPVKELKGFEKVFLKPNETKTVTFELDWRVFAYYEPKIGDWYVESGEFDILIGKSSADIVLTATVEYESEMKLRQEFTADTVFEDIFKVPGGREAVKAVVDKYLAQGEKCDTMPVEVLESMIGWLPLHATMSFSQKTITLEDIREAVEKLNEIEQ